MRSNAAKPETAAGDTARPEIAVPQITGPEITGPEITGIETLHKGWTTLMRVGVRMPDGATFAREVEDHGQAASVLPYDPARRTVWLVRQLRVPMLLKGAGATSLEAPAGIVDEDDPAETARRELMEEVGLRAGPLEPVATTWSSPGLSCERMSLFLCACSGEDRVSEGGGLAQENESITVAEMPVAEAWRLVEEGTVLDLKTLTLLHALRHRHPELFAA